MEVGSKKVKITFHTLIQRMWKKRNEDEREERPFWLIGDVLDYIIRLPKKKKFYDLKENKFCFLESAAKEIIDDNTIFYKGYFKSARNEFRPDLINKRTGAERRNPKEINEGDIEKTHFLFKLSKADNEVYLFLESNYYGVTIHNIVNYITEYTTQYLEKKGEKKNFTIVNLEIPRNNFLTELERLSRTACAEVYFDKKLLGSNALDFSNRTISMKRDIVLSAKASKKESITEFGIDVWNKMKNRDSPISKLRIRGVDNNNNEIMLDTNMMCQTDFVEVDLNPDTGDVNTIQLLAGLKQIANRF